jgi:DNA repair protein RecO (recombination protein O)
MTAPRVYRTEAVVLRALDFGEADRIVTFYTPHLGKLRATAKGVRRLKSRKAGHLDLFMRSNLLVAAGRNLDIVTQAEGIESFRPLREDLRRSIYAEYVAELVDGFSPDRMANPTLYDLLILTLRRLATVEHVELSVRSFELQLLGLAGYRPELFHCLRCNSVIQAQVNRFSAQAGGVLCPACAGSVPLSRSVSVNALKVMRYLQSNEAAILHVRGLDRGVSEEIEQHLQECIAFRLERRPNSFRFVERLRLEGVYT